MKSVALFSLVALWCFTVTPIESAHWGTTGAIGGRKVFFAAPTTTKLNWWNAQKLCRQQGIELGGIESKAEMDALHTLLVDRDGKDEKIYYWTSGSDRGRATNDFAWFSNGRPVKPYSNWNTNEPNNAGRNEDFLHVLHKGSGSTAKYSWNDISEDKVLMSVLCEMDLTSTTPGRGGNPVYFVEANLKLNWYEAARACRQRGMRLASIESQSEADKFTAAVRAFGFTNPTDYWTSGTDNGQAVNSFYWFSTGNPISFKAWRAGEPNNAGNENCLTVRVPTTGAASWNDWTCEGVSNFVCEIRT